MQLITPTPMNAPRQARNASPSSEWRTPGALTINQAHQKEGTTRIYQGIPMTFNSGILPLAAKSSNELKLT